MKTCSSLQESLSLRLKDTKQQKPVDWSVLLKEFVEDGHNTEPELVAAMNTLLMPSGKISGNHRGFWVGLPQ